MKKLYLVDVSSMYFRAFYAIRMLTGPTGMPTNALYGFLSMTTKLLREIRPDYLVYCFDTGEPSFRKEIYSEYKANRSEMPSELIPQVPYVRKIAETLGIVCVDHPGWEADDLIGTYSRIGTENNLQVTIVSGDKDFAQLVSPHVQMYDTMKEIVYDISGVKAKWGVGPEQMVDYLAITGDTSDNIPGVPGIGPKGAQKLLSEFGSLENIYSNIASISSDSVRKKLIEGKDLAFLSKQLVTIEQNLPVKQKLEELVLSPIVPENLRGLLSELGFKTFETKLLGREEVRDEGKLKQPEPMQTDSAQINSKQLESNAYSFVSEPKASQIGEQQNFFDRLVVESETHSSPTDALVLKMEDIPRIIPEDSTLWALWTGRELILDWDGRPHVVSGHVGKVGSFFAGMKIRWKGYDLKSLWHLMGYGGSGLVEWDQMLAAYFVRPGADMDFRVIYKKYFHRELPEMATVAKFLFAQRELEVSLKEKLLAVSGLETLRSLDFALIDVLYSMEKWGIRLDTDLLASQSHQFSEELKVVEKRIYEMAGAEFSILSPKQLSSILFDKLKLPAKRKTKSGYFSTDSDVLLKLSKENPICKEIIEFRELSKLKSTYTDALPLLVDEKTKRVHTSFNQAHTATGRLSSDNPNLQNIPIRTERGSAIRRAFIPESGKILISADYSQIELRILAHVASDPGLIMAFQRDLDIHTATASEIFAKPLGEITPDLRRIAKAVNFGLAYGMEAYGLSENLNISVSEAKEIIQRYFLRFSKVQQYMFDTVETAKRLGYVETMFGRRRYLEELKSSNGSVRQFGERAAINAPIQGTASDIVRQAMIAVYRQLTCRLLLQVHDELVFEVESDQVESSKESIRTVMENVITLSVPLKVNVYSGRNWEEAH